MSQSNVPRFAAAGRAGFPTTPGRLPLALFLALCLLPSAFCRADPPTQEDVFRSIQQNVDAPTDSRRVMAVCAAGGAVLLLLAVISRQRQREASPKALVHPGKLLKEVMRSVSIRPAELKQLRLLAEERSRSAPDDAPLQSPLTLLLCPSVLAKATQGRPGKVDRKALAQIVRKLGLNATAGKSSMR